jgi:hypothetical protein
MVDFKAVEWEHREHCRQYITPERIAEAARKIVAQSRFPALKSKSRRQGPHADDIIVDLCPMHYGMQEKNPMDFINFYSKQHPDSELPIISSKPVYVAQWRSTQNVRLPDRETFR